jgi:hypothetical protein
VILNLIALCIWDGLWEPENKITTLFPNSQLQGL